MRGAQCVWLRTNDPAVCVVTSGVCCYQRCVLLPAVCVATSGVCCDPARGTQCELKHWDGQSPTVPWRG